jgi:hypothetical protein
VGHDSLGRSAIVSESEESARGLGSWSLGQGNGYRRTRKTHTHYSDVIERLAIVVKLVFEQWDILVEQDLI